MRFHHNLVFLLHLLSLLRRSISTFSVIFSFMLLVSLSFFSFFSLLFCPFYSPLFIRVMHYITMCSRSEFFFALEPWISCTIYNISVRTIQ
jgi:hypothetical protein